MPQPYRYTELHSDKTMFSGKDGAGFVHQDSLNEERQSDENDHVVSREDAELNEELTIQKQSVPRVLGYPISIPFIISNEFCERFSYYGMRTILMIYLTEKLLMTTDQATTWYHEFIALCYTTPLLGALVADVIIGKFVTILILSLVYLTGNAVMALTSEGKWFTASTTTDEAGVTSYQPQMWGPLLGLHLIALGTGGIKPCVSSFGGDQFLKSESTRLQRYFSMFYFSINSGAMAATFLTPELRSMGCMGESTCFPLAFGVPALFMVFAVIAFVTASTWYVKVPPLGNPIVDVASVTWAIIWKRKNRLIEFGENKIDEVRQLWRVLAVFIPLPFFWAIYDQQGSRWIVQAKRMNGNIGGNVVIKPDQMQVVNPLLVLCLIPFFDAVIYPLFRRIGLPTSATFRLISGMVLIAVAFITCGFVEIAMEGRVSAWNAVHPSDPRTLDTLDKTEQVHILATLPQILIITCAEILCSITGLEFAYAYAPASLKSVCQSFFLLTNAFGNVLTIIFTKVSHRDVVLYFMWAVIQICASILMLVISQRVQRSLDEYKSKHLESETIVMSNLTLQDQEIESDEPYAN